MNSDQQAKIGMALETALDTVKQVILILPIFASERLYGKSVEDFKNDQDEIELAIKILSMILPIDNEE